MDPFTKQGNCPRTLIRKSPYTKALRLRITVPDLISGGNLFGAIPATFHSLFNKAVFLICHWTTDDLFRITMQCFKSLDTMELVFQQCLRFSLLNNTMPSTCAAEQKMHPSTQQNSGLKLSMNILRTLTSNTGFHTTRRSLRPLVERPYSFREQYREKSIVFTPPLLPAIVD
ncbi:hypothetical protein TNCT_361381, partial [Trichonephila clavata]